MTALGDKVLVRSVAALVVGLILGSIVADNRGYFDDTWRDLDIQADWLVAKAAVDGLDPYVGVEELAAHYEVDYAFNRPDDSPEDASHPRTPGAIILSLPLAAVPYDDLAVVTNGLGLLLIAGAAYYPLRRAHPLVIVAVVLICLTSRTAVWALRFATQAPILAACAAFMLPVIRKDRASAGIALGIAATLKAFPMLMIIPLAFMRRWKAVGWAIGTSVALNAVGLMLPHIHLGRAVEALSAASDRWFQLGGNISLARQLDLLTGIGRPMATLLILAVGVAALSFVLWRMHLPADAQLLLGAAAAVLLSPLTWESYLLFVLPFVVVTLMNSDETVQRWSIVVVLGYGYPVYGIAQFGTLTALSMAALAVIQSRRAREPDYSVLGTPSVHA